jgi:hypothetical protein
VSSGSSPVDPWVNGEAEGDEEPSAAPNAAGSAAHEQQAVSSDAGTVTRESLRAPVTVPPSRIWGSGPYASHDGGCVTCAQAIDSHGDPGWLCPTSVPMFDDVRECACHGLCEHACGRTVCAGRAIDVDCYACLSDFHVGCGVIHEECDNH